MYCPPLRHEKPHIAVGVVADPRPRDSGDIGLVGAASASPRPSPISMPATSPNFTSSMCIASPHVRLSKPLTGGQALLRQSPPEASRLPLRRLRWAASAFCPATSWPHPRRLASTRLDRSARPSASRRFGAKIPPHVGDHRPDPSYHANPRLNLLGHIPISIVPAPSSAPVAIAPDITVLHTIAVTIRTGRWRLGPCGSRPGEQSTSCSNDDQ